MSLTTWLFRRPKASTQPQPLVGTPTPAHATSTQRRYLEDADYLLPKDEGELERLNFQHYALNLTLGNHYLAPLPSVVRTIVEVGTGTGIWCQEMTRLFPESLVLGFDVDTALSNQMPPVTCLLRAGNILTGLPLPDQFGDFTHQRLLVLAIPDERWPGVVSELVRVTRVGGWIELIETDARVQAGGPATAQVMAWIDLVRKERGLQGKAVVRLGDLLERAGVGEIEAQAIPLKVGAWGGRTGLMMERDILAAVLALKEPCCMRGVDGREFDAAVQAMASEWQQAQAFCTIYMAYGKRGMS